jgi:hypothetical protein
VIFSTTASKEVMKVRGTWDALAVNSGIVFGRGIEGWNGA